MATKTQRTERRADALSKERIVEAAIEILDADGESALTFRALTARLATGSGAIFWHVANKNDLLAATTNDVIARVMTEVVSGAEPQEAIRTMPVVDCRGSGMQRRLAQMAVVADRTSNRGSRKQ